MLPRELSGTECGTLCDGIPGEVLFTVYGRAPMMISAGCVRKTSGQCKGSGDAFLQIRDRMGETFPVRCVCGRDRDLCHNVIFNSVPLSLHAAWDDMAARLCAGFNCGQHKKKQTKKTQLLFQSCVAYLLISG